MFSNQLRYWLYSSFILCAYSTDDLFEDPDILCVGKPYMVGYQMIASARLGNIDYTLDKIYVTMSFKVNIMQFAGIKLLYLNKFSNFAGKTY